MRPLFWLCLSPLLCLGIVALTSFILFYSLRRGTRAIDEHLQDEAKASSGESAGVDSSPTPKELSEGISTNSGEEVSACPACGGENPAGTSKCAYCGRKL